MNVESLLRELDRLWTNERVALRIFGSTALMLQTSYSRGTTDSDLLETVDLSGASKKLLIDLAGSGSELARRHGIHLQIVLEAIPFLPQQPRWHPVRTLSDLASFDVTVLDVTDVVTSKLKRFSARDRRDIVAMIDGGHVEHALLVERFRLAVDYLIGDAREQDLPRIIANLHEIERETFGVEPTEIVLPSWI